MKEKRYTVAEAQRNFETLIQEAEEGTDIYIVDEDKRMVKVVPLAADKEHMPGGFEGKISATPNAFDPLIDEEIKDWGFK